MSRTSKQWPHANAHSERCILQPHTQMWINHCKSPVLRNRHLKTFGKEETPIHGDLVITSARQSNFLSRQLQGLTATKIRYTPKNQDPNSFLLRAPMQCNFDKVTCITPLQKAKFRFLVRVAWNLSRHHN